MAVARGERAAPLFTAEVKERRLGDPMVGARFPWAIAPSTEAATMVAAGDAERIGSTSFVERRSGAAAASVSRTPAPPTTYSTEAAG